jgi:hypothetical protein
VTAAEFTSPKRRKSLSGEARRAKADVAQLAERVLGKDEVTGSIPVIGSIDDAEHDVVSNEAPWKSIES